ncbi:chromobox protein homolog 1-like [Aphis gossypii]|uniref:chromobox protein homolog 1-like n=1 Tax=Aphis gossypii TaxID=80765 RepID=UPI002158A30E|nr:chromobox protein homolog 1-like [Aphis gossypii]
MSPKYVREDSESNDQFSVEKVLAKRIRRGKTEYFLKWIGYPNSDNTWEPAQNLDCPELIQEFEELELKNKKYQQERKRKRSLSRATACSTVTSGTSSAAGSSSSKAGPSKEVKSTFIQKNIKLEKSDEIERTVDGEQNSVPEKQVNGVSLMPIPWPSQKVPERIIGVTDAGGTFSFLMKWVGIDEAELVVSREAHVMCPQVVIDFYEKNVIWKHPASSVGESACQCTCHFIGREDKD